MRNLRERVELDLGTTMENPNQWGLPVELTAPDGKVYKTSKNSPDPQNPLPIYGQVLRNTTRESLDGPGLVVTHSPAVSLRITSLERVPKSNERWFIKFPTEPSLTAEMQNYALQAGRAPEVNSSIGHIVLYPTKADQLI
jgi:hypothetical protein